MLFVHANVYLLQITQLYSISDLYSGRIILHKGYFGELERKLSVYLSFSNPINRNTVEFERGEYEMNMLSRVLLFICYSKKRQQ